MVEGNYASPIQFKQEANVDRSTAQRAEDLHEEARQMEDDDAALALYHQALQLDPDRASTLYNIGLIHKYRGEWEQSRDFNRRAVELQPDDEASNWNLAIAATALHDWACARATWKRLGMPIEEGDTPIETDFGLTPVRLNPDDSGEVVWGQRVDPVRVRIDNVPYPASGFRCGDVVLHDGAPVGSRMSRGREYHVFNVLALFQPSRLATFEAEVVVSNAADLQMLSDALQQAEVMHEDWTSNVRTLCKQCSEGSPHEHHDEDLAHAADGRHLIGIAAEDGEVALSVLNQWRLAPGRELVRFACMLAAPDRH